MNWGRTRYYFAELWRNLRRQPLLALTTIATVGMSLMLLGFFAVIWVGAEDLIGRFAQEVHMSVYLQPDLEAPQQRTLLTALRSRPEVADLRQLTSEQDRERNRESLPPTLVENLPAGVIPGAPCIDLVLKPEQRTREAVRQIAQFSESLEGVEGVVSVLSGGQKVQLAFAVVDAVRVFGFVVCLLLAVGAVFFVFSTIRLSVHARKDEVEARQLMGATRTFIRVPFYLEGAVEGGLGAMLACAIVWTMVGRFNDYLKYTQLIRYELSVLSFELFMTYLAGGIALGLIGSAFALGRYLRKHG